MNFIFSPARIDIVVSVDPETRALIDRALSLIEDRPKLEAAGTALDASTKGLQQAVDAAKPQP